MDSPGHMPASLGDVWVGTTACAPQACIIDWPYPFRTHPSPYQPPGWHPVVESVRFIPTTTTTTTIAAAPLSDADVERIARRVAELLREGKP